MVPSKFDASCPICGHDKYVRKVSSVKYTPDAQGASKKLSDDLEEIKLAAPPKPSSSKGMVVFFLIGITFLCGCAGVFAITAAYYALALLEKPANLILLTIFTLGVLTFVLWILLSMLIRHIFKKSDKDSEKRLNEAKRKWDELYYCELHDLAFVPGTDIAMPSEKVQDYIYGGTMHF